ncbi:sensor histidine kinase [Clostridium sp.]|jgi:signal transduction histidine kinase|uniref:sensor histidine kinase n=2 Tax=Clostridium sp. TaxID=1506 RepID=UPI0025BC3304|nr:HAMP domain-containing sensor histidine kinase [Clostridium sp.]MCI1716745.1 HAMP domain-containing histidine kinase [Clostridium sp.]MCI1801071.1 HAMP domain-containing histidine kinase [Clostridium sp.]MCI1814931.1 HAMP domain-containing histidine kinase [Clostridium sp.]MCI1871832.1 HAMP domain-containing histidine kinase [Clostridium sp.]MCI2200396.1 HAMP domain-containing histidine kinase [Clostridium sp.]
MGLKNSKSFRSLFVEYIIYFIFSTFILFLFVFFGFDFMLKANIVFPANYFEKKIQQNGNEIARAEKVTEALVPEGCQYGVYSRQGKVLYGNFKAGEFQEVWRDFKNNKMNSGRNGYYKFFYRNDEICIVRYPLTVQFTNLFLRKYFPNVENVSYIFVFLIFIVGILLLSGKFGRYFSKEMDILMKIVERIKQHNLDFNPRHSRIHEIDKVINSLDEMKRTLKDSLEKQWDMESARKNQISSLAHDIKTPLTIIKGNAELMKESCSDSAAMKYNQHILESAGEIERYLELLMDMIKSESSIDFNPVKIDTKTFFKKLESQGKALAARRDLQFEISKGENVPEFFRGDENLLYRALLNVISNAVEYSSEGGKINFKLERKDHRISFSVEDSGMGFSKEELQLAVEQFYRGDSSRTSRTHYGMGLFIAKSFMKLHGVCMKLLNSEITGGALVILEMPLDVPE